MASTRENQASRSKNSDKDLSTKPTQETPLLKESETYFKSPYWGMSYDFPWNPDPLCKGNNYTTYDEMRDDDQIKTCLTLKKDMILNTGWNIQTEDGNEEAIDYITDNLEQLGEYDNNSMNFDAVLRNILTSFDYGFSISEPVFELVDGKYRLKSVHTRAPHSFKIHIDDKGFIEKFTQSTNLKEIDLDPKKLIHHVYQYDFGNPYGKSDFRSAYNAWKSKKFFNKMFAMYVERYAMPVPVAKYPDTYTQSEVDQLHKVLQSMRASAYITVEDKVAIDFMEANNDSSGIYLKGLDYYNLQISRSLLMPDLLGISGAQTSGGSFALGKEHFKLFLNILKKERITLENKITTRIIRPMAMYNFGDFPVWFEFKPWSFEDIKEYLRLWLDAIGQKVYIPTDEEINYFRNSIGFPEGAIERPEPIMPINPLLNKGGGINDKMRGGKETEGKEIDEDEEEKKEPEEKQFSYRVFTRYEKKCNFELIKSVMDKGEEKTVKKVISAGKSIYNSLIEQIISMSLLTKFNPEKINKLQPKNMKPMNMLLKDYFYELFIDSYNNAQQEIFPNQEQKKFAIELLPEEFLEILDAESFNIVGDYVYNMTKKARSIVTQGIKDGWGQSEIVKMLRTEAEDLTDTWANTMLRTKTTEVYNEARRKYYETDPLAKEVVEAYQWSAILDDRTSEVCRELDKTIFPVDMADSLKPPAHFNAVLEGTLIKNSKDNIPIENIKIGDFVVTHTGKLCEVYDVMDKFEDKEYYRITLDNNSVISITGEHPALTSRGWVRVDELKLSDNIICFEDIANV